MLLRRVGWGAGVLKSDDAAATERLMATGWLNLTPPDFARAILANCHWRSVPAAQAIQHAGDRNIGIFGVARGTVAITTMLGFPGVPMMHIAHAGLWFGYVALFTGRDLPVGIPRAVMSALPASRNRSSNRCSPDAPNGGATSASWG